MKLTIEMMTEKLCDNEKTHKTIMEKIDKFGEQLEALKVQIAQLPDAIFERGDKRYASKTSEKVIYGLVGVILTAFILAVVEIVGMKF